MKFSSKVIKSMRIILSVCMSIILMLSNIAVITAAEPEASCAELNDIVINGMSIPGFVGSQTEYDMALPYVYEPNVHTISQELDVEVYPACKECEYVITEPDTVNGGTLIVSVSCSEHSENIYTIALSAVGENMYTDGGYEEGLSAVPTSGKSKLSRIEENPGAGNYSLLVTKANTGYFQWYHNPRPTLLADKTYIAHSMARLNDMSVSSYELTSFFDRRGDNKPIFLKDDGAVTENKVTLTNEWKSNYAILPIVGDYVVEHFYVEPSWSNSKIQPATVVDEYYVGELVVTDMDYDGETTMNVPEKGENTYEVNVINLKNQFGSSFGLDPNAKIDEANKFPYDIAVEWEVAGNYPGVVTEGTEIKITDEAVESTIRLRAIVTVGTNETKFAKSFPVSLVANGETASVPKARNVSVSGIVEEDNVLEGSYTYYNAKGLAESGTTYRWLWSDTADGSKNPVEGATGTSYTVEEQYKDKYLFFEVTPRCEAGEGESVLSTFIVKPEAPTAEEVSATGGGYVGSKISGTYVYNDRNFDSEAATTFRWLRSDTTDVANDGTAIPGAVGKEYIVTNDDIGKYIAFEVTPVSDTVPEVGEPVLSTPVLAADYPVVSDVEIKSVGTDVYKVTYKYSHPLDIAEGDTRIQWYVNDAQAGNDASQKAGTGAEKISVSVTAIASKEPCVGETVTTSLTISRRPSTSIGNTRPAVGGGGGSFGGGSSGGGSVIVPIPEPKEEAKPEEPEAPTYWADEGINFVKSQNIMQEIAPGDFGNAQIVTRADFVYYIMKAIGAKETAYRGIFDDVTSGDYYAGMLQTAVDMGIISSDMNFNPKSSVTREQISKILTEAAGLEAVSNPSIEQFLDKELVSEWAKGYVACTYDSGLLKGVSSTEFNPLGMVTREQTAVIVKRLFDYKNGGTIK